MHYFVHDITDPSNVSKFEIELDDPGEGDALETGTMVYEIVTVRGAVIEVVQRVGPGRVES